MAKGGDQGARILIVDDDPVVAAAVAALLRGDGHTVQTAGDGQGALAALRESRRQAEGPFRLIISDVHMPRTDGLELLRQVRRDHPAVALIFVTGYASVETAVEALRLGASITCPSRCRPIDCVRRSPGHCGSRR
jgi:CheY-like chemotaxis protein